MPAPTIAMSPPFRLALITASSPAAANGVSPESSDGISVAELATYSVLTSSPYFLYRPASIGIQNGVLDAAIALYGMLNFVSAAVFPEALAAAAGLTVRLAGAVLAGLIPAWPDGAAGAEEPAPHPARTIAAAGVAKARFRSKEAIIPRVYSLRPASSAAYRLLSPACSCPCLTLTRHGRRPDHRLQLRLWP